MLGEPVRQKHDVIWHQNLSILWEKGRLFEFWPNAMHSREEKVNAIVRFALYASLMLYIMSKKTKYLIMGMAAIIVISYGNRQASQSPVPAPAVRQRLGPAPLLPDNPFGNQMSGTDVVPPNEDDYEDDETEDKREQLARKGLFMNFEDAWKKHTSDRQFYKMPEHDQGAFAKYLYGDMHKSQEKLLEKTSHV